MADDFCTSINIKARREAMAEVKWAVHITMNMMDS